MLLSHYRPLVTTRRSWRLLSPPGYLSSDVVLMLLSPLQAIGDDEEELGGFVTTEEFLRLRDTSTCGKMQASIAVLAASCLESRCGVQLRDTSTCGKMQVRSVWLAAMLRSLPQLLCCSQYSNRMCYPPTACAGAGQPAGHLGGRGRQQGKLPAAVPDSACLTLHCAPIAAATAGLARAALASVAPGWRVATKPVARTAGAAVLIHRTPFMAVPLTNCRCCCSPTPSACCASCNPCWTPGPTTI